MQVQMQMQIQVQVHVQVQVQVLLSNNSQTNLIQGAVILSNWTLLQHVRTHFLSLLHNRETTGKCKTSL